MGKNSVHATEGAQASSSGGEKTPDPLSLKRLVTWSLGAKTGIRRGEQIGIPLRRAIAFKNSTPTTETRRHRGFAEKDKNRKTLVQFWPSSRFSLRHLCASASLRWGFKSNAIALCCVLRKGCYHENGFLFRNTSTSGRSHVEGIQY